MIESAVVAAIFSDVDHALEASIEGGVENFALRFSAAFHRNLAEGFVPSFPSCILYSFKSPVWNFPPEIFLCLLRR